MNEANLPSTPQEAMEHAIDVARTATMVEGSYHTHDIGPPGSDRIVAQSERMGGDNAKIENLIQGPRGDSHQGDHEKVWGNTTIEGRNGATTHISVEAATKRLSHFTDDKEETGSYKIVRTDKDGNEILRKQVDDPVVARRLGVMVAKRVARDAIIDKELQTMVSDSPKVPVESKEDTPDEIPA